MQKITRKRWQCNLWLRWIPMLSIILSLHMLLFITYDNYRNKNVQKCYILSFPSLFAHTCTNEPLHLICILQSFIWVTYLCYYRFQRYSPTFFRRFLVCYTQCESFWMRSYRFHDPQNGLCILLCRGAKQKSCTYDIRYDFKVFQDLRFSKILIPIKVI